MEPKISNNTFTFPSTHRLKSKKDFSLVREDDSKLFSKDLIIYFKDNELKHSRIGIVVSKKVHKRAVRRNRVKRRIREIYRLNQHDLPAVDLVIIAKKHILESNYQQIEKGFLKALQVLHRGT